jgi:hypothetical protein
MFTRSQNGKAIRSQQRNRLLSSAIVFGLAASSFGGIAVAMPNPGAQQQQAVTLDQQKAVLSQYGRLTTLPQCCRPPVLGGPVKPIDGGIGTVATGPKPGRTPPIFGRGNGPDFTNIGRQADVGGGAIRPGPVFTGRSVANPVLAHSGAGVGGGAPMHPAMGFGHFR